MSHYQDSLLKCPVLHSGLQARRNASHSLAMAWRGQALSAIEDCFRAHCVPCVERESEICVYFDIIFDWEHWQELIISNLVSMYTSSRRIVHRAVVCLFGAVWHVAS